MLSMSRPIRTARPSRIPRRPPPDSSWLLVRGHVLEVTVDHLVDRAVAGHLAAAHPEAPVAELAEESQVVRDDHDDVRAIQQVEDPRPRLVEEGGVAGAERF